MRLLSSLQRSLRYISLKGAHDANTSYRSGKEESGAEGGSRTRTSFRTTDFKSGAT